MNLVFASGVLFPQQFGPLQYFRGLPDLFPPPAAIFPKVSLIGKIDRRAHDLADQISAHDFPDNGPIHIIAHSMAGLDARHLLAKNLNGLTSRIASLSTISTPHRGSPVADVIDAGLADGLLKKAIDFLLQEKRDALDDLTTAACAAFNAENADVAGIRYLSYAGGSPTSILLTPTHDFIEETGTTPEEKANDGAVPVASAKWPLNLAEDAWEADHFAEVGHKLGVISPFNHVAAFQRVIQRATGQP